MWDLENGAKLKIPQDAIWMKNGVVPSVCPNDQYSLPSFDGDFIPCTSTVPNPKVYRNGSTCVVLERRKDMHILKLMGK